MSLSMEMRASASRLAIKTHGEEENGDTRMEGETETNKDHILADCLL